LLNTRCPCFPRVQRADVTARYGILHQLFRPHSLMITILSGDGLPTGTSVDAS
jgi:hypothetical protein